MFVKFGQKICALTRPYSLFLSIDWSAPRLGPGLIKAKAWIDTSSYYICITLSLNSVLFFFQIENINEPSLIYACIFLLRMKLLETSNTSMFHRLNFLMEGNTNDLENEVTFTSEAFHLMHTKMHLDNLSKEDVIRFMGIKRTNAREETKPIFT